MLSDEFSGDGERKRLWAFGKAPLKTFDSRSPGPTWRRAKRGYPSGCGGRRLVGRTEHRLGGAGACARRFGERKSVLKLMKQELAVLNFLNTAFSMGKHEKHSREKGDTGEGGMARDKDSRRLHGAEKHHMKKKNKREKEKGYKRDRGDKDKDRADKDKGSGKHKRRKPERERDRHPEKCDRDNSSSSSDAFDRSRSASPPPRAPPVAKADPAAAAQVNRIFAWDSF
ncbi:hypothetical protein T492DRAFT_847849 [Pavlovales sp. CCMP2436]|nr:hypothetical protein T492DRAFT_847849 [Pavlovales sp. CCMP2436]